MARNVEYLNDGTVKVSKTYLMNRYMKNAIIPQDIYWECIDKSGYIVLPKYRLDEMEKKYFAYNEREKLLSDCANLNNKGIAFEKSGDINSAIKVYEQNIASDNPYPATHSFDRLMILYRKQKDYNNEIRIIEKAIKVFPSFKKYKERLIKTKSLINRK